MSTLRRYAWIKKEKSSKISNKNIVLFDMDGTLTPPRQKFDVNLLQPLRTLAKHAEIGIVSGSDYNYISEQLELLIQRSELKYKLHLLPCNGTKYYSPPKDNISQHTLIESQDMRSYLGKAVFDTLVREILSLQEHISWQDIPLSGNFISYRDSMINWCPSGRDMSPSQREAFITKDGGSKPSLRERYLHRLLVRLDRLALSEKIVCTLGGDTSFDIYPAGWDKTYALKYFQNRKVWFVGDRCEDGGNDKTLYDALLKEKRAWQTTGPKNTKDIMEIITKDIQGEML